MGRPVDCPECGQLIQIDVTADGQAITSRILSPPAQTKSGRQSALKTYRPREVMPASSTPDASPSAVLTPIPENRESADGDDALDLSQLTPSHSTSLRWAWGVLYSCPCMNGCEQCTPPEVLKRGADKQGVLKLVAG